MPKLEIWQKAVYDAMEDSDKSGKIFLCKARRQCGKSILAIVILIKFALTKKSTSVIIEPTQAQCRRVFKQLEGFLEGSGAIISANATLLTMEFANGSEILFKSAEQQEALRGMTVKNGILVIDEAAFIKDDIFEILYPITDANNAPILVISTPLFCSGEFYSLYERGMSGLGNIEVFDWSGYDTSKYLPPAKLEYYRKTVSPQKFQSEYLGEFIKEGSYLFGDVRKCLKESKEAAAYAAIDWATGNDGDNTVLTLMDGLGTVTNVYYFNHMDATEQIMRIAEILNNEHSLRVCQVELNSLGRVFYDNLRGKVKVNVKGFVTTNDTKREIIENLISAFQTKTIGIPEDGELMSELQHYAIQKTSKGYTYNGENGHKDDAVISLALCYDAFKKNYGGFTISFA